MTGKKESFHTDSTEDSLPADHSLNGFDASVEAQPVSKQDLPIQFGRYELRELLGEGAMGRVYKAYDTQLQRTVAMKFLRSTEIELVHRFLQEARAQARVDHDNVCKVYDVGSIEGRPYIAMQFIQGVPLDTAIQGMSLEKKLGIIRDAARGLQAAHAQGLIHRDIKPSNILVQNGERPKPYIVDFGLAKASEAPGLTQSGVILGTPSYMAPEQAHSGSAIDSRVDIYSLGATLYRIVVGHPPFEGEDILEILVKLVQQDPVPVRKLNPALSVDLNTVVMKCLEKNPSRRYESMNSLLEDIDRLINGEPVRATRPSLVHIATQKLRKNRLTASLIALAAVFLLVFTGRSVRSEMQRRLQAKLLIEFLQEARHTEDIMEHACKAPLHNVTREREQATIQLERIRVRMLKEGSVALGPGNYALGRGYMALREFDKARQHMEAAWSRYGYRIPEVAYSLGLILSELYKQELPLVRRIQDEERRKSRNLEMDKQYRIPVQKYIELGRPSGSLPVEYVEAILFFLDGKYPKAIEKAQEASRKEPWLYDADLLIGDAYGQMADAEIDSGLNEAVRHLEKAKEAYAGAIQKAPSDVAPYEGLGWAEVVTMDISIYRSTESLKLAYEKALEVAGWALVANPRSSIAFRIRSRSSFRWAEYLETHGEDPREVLKLAVEAARLGLEVKPQDEMLYRNMAVSYLVQARYEMKHGIPPQESFRQAGSSFAQGVKLNPEEFANYNNLGVTLYFQARWEFDAGRDPGATLKAALEALRHAIRLKPNAIYAQENFGLVYSLQGRYEAATGKDSSKSLAAAVKYCSDAIRLDGKFSYGYRTLGLALTETALQTLRKKESPESVLQQAFETLQKGLQIKDDFDELWLFQGKAYWIQGLRQYSLDQSPESSCLMAEESLNKALERNAQSADAYLLLAQVHRLRAEWRHLQKQKAQTDIRAGLKMVEQASRLNSYLVETKALHAALLILQSEESQGPVSVRTAQQAYEILQQALQSNPFLKPEYEYLLQNL